MKAHPFDAVVRPPLDNLPTAAPRRRWRSVGTAARHRRRLLLVYIILWLDRNPLTECEYDGLKFRLDYEAEGGVVESADDRRHGAIADE